MRLISLSISNFGTLSNYKIDFTDNPTIILENNGWGKSTLATFIKVMFYGFYGESKRNPKEREREKYRPWNKGLYGGMIVFESGGKKYEISKVFGDKEKDDDCVLCDYDTRLRILDADAAHLGYDLFSLDEKSFMRSVFIAQNDVRVHEEGKDDISDGISAKIGNLSDATDDVNRYEVVMERLNDILNKMSPKRATGSIKQMDAHISAIDNNLREEASVKSSVEYLEGKIREEQDKIKTLRSERNRIEQDFTENAKKGELIARKEAFDHIWKQYEAAKENLSKMSESFVNGLPKEKELNSKIEDWSRRSMLLSSIESKQVSLDYMLKNREDELEREAEKRRIEEEEERDYNAFMEKRRKAGIILIAASIISFVLGAAITFVFNHLYPGLGAAGFGVMCLIVGLIVIPFGYKADTTPGETTEDESKELAVVDISPDTVDMTDAAKAVYLAGISGAQDSDTPEILEMRAQILSAAEEAAGIESDVHEFLNYYRFTYLPDNIEACLYDIRQQINVYNSKVEDVEQKRTAVKEFESINDMTSIMNISASDTESPVSLDINDERAQLEEEIREHADAIRQYRLKLEENLERLSQLSDLKEEMARLTEERDDNLHKYEMLSLTRDFLKKSKENFSAKYRKQLLDGFKKYYSYLSDEESSEFQIDSNIRMSRREMGEARDTECFSNGNRDLYDICLRMALVDAMFTDEKPFIILDDPFVNLDKQKTEKALIFLEKISEDYQVIYFTCHESRA